MQVVTERFDPACALIGSEGGVAILELRAYEVRLRDDADRTTAIVHDRYAADAALYEQRSERFDAHVLADAHDVAGHRGRDRDAFGDVRRI
jgi:hypothetical protein